MAPKLLFIPRDVSGFRIGQLVLVVCECALMRRMKMMLMVLLMMVIEVIMVIMVMMVIMLIMVMMPTASPSLTFVLMVVSRAARGVPSTW